MIFLPLVSFSQNLYESEIKILFWDSNLYKILSLLISPNLMQRIRQYLADERISVITVPFFKAMGYCVLALEVVLWVMAYELLLFEIVILQWLHSLTFQTDTRFVSTQLSHRLACNHMRLWALNGNSSKLIWSFQSQKLYRPKSWRQY